MAQIDPPKPNPLIEWMAKLLREKAPGVAETAGKVAEYPPVNLMAKLLNAGDPMGVMGIGMPLQAFDAWGKAVKVSADTGKPLAKTARDVARMKAQAELATRLGRGEGTHQAFRGVAFRNVATGEVMEGGTFHPDLANRLPAGHATTPDASRGGMMRSVTPEKYWEEGFVTKDGNFLNRRDATKYVPDNQRQYLGQHVDSDDVFNVAPQKD